MRQQIIDFNNGVDAEAFDTGMHQQTLVDAVIKGINTVYKQVQWGGGEGANVVIHTSGWL